MTRAHVQSSRRRSRVPVTQDGYIDLSQQLYPGMSTSHAHGVPVFTVKEHHAAAVRDISITYLSMSAHAGTHIDAARHFFPDGPTIDEYPIDRFHGPGVVLDVRRDGPEPLTADDIRRCEVTPQAGDIVLLSFGWAEHYGTDRYAEHPYLTGDAAELLVELGVRMVGVDTITPDLPDFARQADFAFPVHRTLLAEDILIIENLGSGLRELLGRRIEVFAVPLAIRGGDGAPVRVFGRAA